MNSSDPYTAPAAPLADPHDNKPSAYFLLRCWRGEARLWQAFWLILIGGYVLVNALGIGLSWGVHWITPQWSPIALGAMMVSISIQMLFGAICVWRCAPNKSLPGVGIAARIFVFLTVAALTYEVFMLWAV